VLRREKREREESGEDEDRVRRGQGRRKKRDLCVILHELLPEFDGDTSVRVRSEERGEERRGQTKEPWLEHQSSLRSPRGDYSISRSLLLVLLVSQVK
jgi:hypothetical protein